MDATDTDDSAEVLDEVALGDRTGFPVGGRTVGFSLTLVVTLAALVVDLTRTGPLVADWDPTATEWLFLPSLAAFGWYAVAPLVTRPTLRERLWETFRERPPAVLAAAYLTVFAAVGLVGPVILGTPPLQSRPGRTASGRVHDPVVRRDGVCRSDRRRSLSRHTPTPAGDEPTGW